MYEARVTCWYADMASAVGTPFTCVAPCLLYGTERFYDTPDIMSTSTFGDITVEILSLFIT